MLCDKRIFLVENDLKINFEGKSIKFNEKSSICIDYCISDYKFTVINSALYISLFDMCRILSIRSKWDYSRSTISLYWDKINYRNCENVYGRVSLIRF